MRSTLTITKTQISAKRPVFSLLCLVLYSLNPCPDCLLVPKISTLERCNCALLLDRAHVIVKLINQWDRSGDIKTGDFVAVCGVRSVS